jgi:methyl-accepting chemotaxis protein
MRRFLLSVTSLVVLLLLATIVYSTLESIRRINSDMRNEKERVVKQLVDYFNGTLEAMSRTGSDPEYARKLFREDLFSGEGLIASQALLDFLSNMQRQQFNADYLAYVSNGMVVSMSVAEDSNISQADVPRHMPEEQYELLEEAGGRKGHFISFYSPFPMMGAGEEFITLMVDRTESINELEALYRKDKEDLVKRQVVAGLIILLLGAAVSALGVYWLTRRDITGPIEEINRTAERIMEGSFEGEVEVDRDSDFAPLQALLSSGKKILDKLNELE